MPIPRSLDEDYVDTVWPTGYSEPTDDVGVFRMNVFRFIGRPKCIGALTPNFIGTIVYYYAHANQPRPRYDRHTSRGG